MLLPQRVADSRKGSGKKELRHTWRGLLVLDLNYVVTKKNYTIRHNWEGRHRNAEGQFLAFQLSWGPELSQPTALTRTAPKRKHSWTCSPLASSVFKALVLHLYTIYRLKLSVYNTKHILLKISLNEYLGAGFFEQTAGRRQGTVNLSVREACSHCKSVKAEEVVTIWWSIRAHKPSFYFSDTVNWSCSSSSSHSYIEHQFNTARNWICPWLQLGISVINCNS